MNEMNKIYADFKFDSCNMFQNVGQMKYMIGYVLFKNHLAEHFTTNGLN